MTSYSNFCDSVAKIELVALCRIAKNRTPFGTEFL